MCYYCDSKWNLEHKRKTSKLFLIEVEDKGDEEWEVPTQFSQAEVGKEMVELPEVTNKPEIYLHALVGSSNPQTMSVKGKVARQRVVLMIDSGSTHNFIDWSVAKRSKFSIYLEESVKVRVGNGDQLVSEGKCGPICVRVG